MGSEATSEPQVLSADWPRSVGRSGPERSDVGFTVRPGDEWRADLAVSVALSRAFLILSVVVGADARSGRANSWRAIEIANAPSRSVPGVRGQERDPFLVNAP